MNIFKLFCKAFIASFSIVLFSSTALSCISTQAQAHEEEENQSDFIQLVQDDESTTGEATLPLQVLGNIISSADYDSLDIERLAIPLCSAALSPHDAQDHEVHTYNGFTLCYRESYEQSEWVAYVLTKEEVLGVEEERSNDFRADTLISTGSATPADYKKSGYDRGHLAPSADMRWSSGSMKDCFLMSNMSPQSPALNRRIWKNLEEKVRSWAVTYGFVVVVTGPLLEKPSSYYNTIGANNVSVPEWFYKALLTFEKQSDGSILVRATAFIMPNEVPPDAKMMSYQTTIDEVEERTALDLFSALPDYVENYVEAQSNF